MNKRTFTITLLIWLFSQQLAIAASGFSDVHSCGVEYGQNHCENNSGKAMHHVIPAASDGEPSASDEEPSANNKKPLASHDPLIANCDLCITACQPLLTLYDTAIFMNASPSTLIPSPATSSPEGHIGITYRPPISA